MNIEELTDAQVNKLKKADFSWGWFIFWLLVANGLGAIGYVYYYLNKERRIKGKIVV